MLLKSLIYDCIWEPCSSFESMRGEYDVECEEYSYTESDIDNFVEIVFRQVAEELEVKFSDISDILYGRNRYFLEKKAKYFENNEILCESEDEYSVLMYSLKIPSVSNLSLTPVDRFIKEFKELKPEEKAEVLTHLEKVKVFLPAINMEYVSDDEFWNGYVNLSEKDKCHVLNSLKHTRIDLE